MKSCRYFGAATPFARPPQEFLKDGDMRGVEIAKIGILRNSLEISALAKV